MGLYRAKDKRDPLQIEMRTYQNILKYLTSLLRRAFIQNRSFSNLMSWREPLLCVAVSCQMGGREGWSRVESLCRTVLLTTIRSITPWSWTDVLMEEDRDENKVCGIPKETKRMALILASRKALAMQQIKSTITKGQKTLVQLFKVNIHFKVVRKANARWQVLLPVRGNNAPSLGSDRFSCFVTSLLDRRPKACNGSGDSAKLFSKALPFSTRVKAFPRQGWG